MTIRISHLRQEPRANSNDLIARVRGNGIDRDLVFSRFFTQTERFNCKSNLDPFVVLTLLPAMRSGESIEIDGEVSQQLLSRINHEIQDIALTEVVGLRRVEVNASQAVEQSSEQGGHVATGFSGGIDSLHLLDASLFRNRLSKSMRVSLLVHNAVGSVKTNQQFHNNFDHTKRVAEKLNLAVAGASCEMEDLYEGLSFAKTHHFRIVAAALSLGSLFTVYLYCSSIDAVTASRLTRHRSFDRVGRDLLPLFDTGRNRFMDFGDDTIRTEKVWNVLNNAELASVLNVCARPDHDNSDFLNCGRCFKCFPVLLHAEYFGKLKKIESVFDLDAYQSNKSRCYLNLFRRGMRATDSMQFVRHTFEMIRRSGRKSPVWIRTLAKFVPKPLVEPHESVVHPRFVEGSTGDI
jgi:hypothetical protein